ncbi:MAG: hypothetical protein QXL76_00475 [Candidatus Rehaiarchaeum fermentans]|nr:hypothetical protein [Candidatus Rehaiarchaeum fermentans]
MNIFRKIEHVVIAIALFFGLAALSYSSIANITLSKVNVYEVWVISILISVFIFYILEKYDD